MAVSVSCPQCQASFPVSADLLGKKMRCRGCQTVFVGEAATPNAGSAVGPRPGSNGVRTETPSAPSMPKPKDNSALLAFVGIGTAVAIMGAVTTWALFFRGGSSDTNTQNPVVANNVMKINLGDAPKDSMPVKVEEPKTNETPKVVEKVPEKPKFTVAKFDETPKNLPYRIDPTTEERVKKSAGWFKVESSHGGGFGSGWMAEPGIMITNSHVIGMKGPASAPPKWVKIVFDSGLSTERTFEAKILGIDRDNDLAVLRIEGDNLPDPMPICRSAELVEGQHLYVVGFPRGNMVAKIFSDDKNTLETTVKVRQSTVVGRMPTKTGSIKLVQIEGGADPGNSGSMIVDSLGNVRLIHVMGFGPALKFSIPSEYAVYLLQGRMLTIVPSQPVESGGVVKQHLAATVSDPMKRVKSIALDLWTGEPGRKIRSASETAPSAQPNDGNKQTVEMTYNADQVIAIGESRNSTCDWNMPDIAEGHVFWMQPRYTGFDGKVRWGEAAVLETTRNPVQEKPAMFSIKHKAGDTHKVHMVSHIGFGATQSDGVTVRNNGMVYDLTEKTLAVQPDGTAKIQMTFNDLSPTDEDTAFTFKELVKGILESAKGMVTEMQVSKRGLIRSPKVDLKKVPVPIRRLVDRYNVQVIQSLESLSLALPDREMKPGETWQQDQNYTVTFGGELSENALFKTTFKYAGTRIRNGREEAVVEFEGKIVRGEESKAMPEDEQPKGKGKGGEKAPKMSVRGMHGHMRGSALVDLATGLTSIARSTGELEFQVDYGGAMVSFGGKFRIDMERQIVPGEYTKNPRQLLSNHEVLLNPFVGSPDHKLTQSPAAPEDRKVTTTP